MFTQSDTPVTEEVHPLLSINPNGSVLFLSKKKPNLGITREGMSMSWIMLDNSEKWMTPKNDSVFNKFLSLNSQRFTD